MMLKLRFLSLLLFSATLGLAQGIKKFTPDRQAFLSELAEVLKETNFEEKTEMEGELNQFATVWNSGGISDEEAEQVYKISNHLLRKRMNSFIGWRDFLGSISHLETNEEEKYLLLWLEDLEELSKSRPARYSEDYLHTSFLTFTESTLFNDGRSRWMVLNGDYKFEFDGEPVFTYEMADVWGYFKDDSTLIEGTSLQFYPRQYRLVGKGGITYFTRAGLSADSAYVELSQYEIDVRKADFEADSAKLVTKMFFTEPTLGYYQEKLTSRSGRDASFPRFFSYRKDIEVPNLLPGANYVGGFSMIGSKFYGSGSENKKAELSFAYEGKEVVLARADRFLLRPDKLESNEVQLTMKLKEDSIFHPKVTMRYLAELQQLNIFREKEGVGQTPFSDSYHEMDMFIERISWKLGDPQMYIGNLNMGAENPVIFESKQYYRGSRFSALSGLDNQNPLYRLKQMVDVYGKREFTSAEVGQALRMTEQNAHIFMMQMSVMGFVEYNVDRREAIIGDKVFAYINNHEKKRDYDVIRFVSNLSQGSNARLSLLNYDLEIDGVNSIALSDSQKVGLFPTNGQIIIHEDLNFDFDGRITAGRFTYWGETFKFNYDQFRINMNEIDSMRFKVLSFDQNALGQRHLVSVKTVLQGLTGELLIDDPNNKSGKDVYSEYPIFKSAKDSYVYYDKKNIFNGVYDRTEFYVQLEPFTIDSLDNTTTEGLVFDGTFTSAGIFPDMDQTLKVQRDYSLGFTTETPPAGLAAYGGKGTYTSTISLSNEGLRGNGRIDYLNSYATSEEFFFFPDSTNGQTTAYEITAQATGTEYPHVLADQVALHWEPKNDVLYTTSAESGPFQMYDDIGMLGTGTLAHGPSALRGKGLMQFLNAETRSKDYLFKNRKFSSGALAFQVRANEEAEWGFAMENARGEVDFNREKGDFTLNDPAGFFSFPDNMYICYMDHAKWNIPEKSVSVDKTGAQASSLMVSVHPQQDSLRFQAGRTKFFLENSLLESFEVPNIEVADASIFPDTGYVAIERKADMRTLNNAAITANRETQHHSFYGGVIDIESRRYYEGSADYEYLDQDGTPWPIHFENVHVDDSIMTTVGKAQVKQEDDFYMSPYFAFYGRVALKADRKALDFKGFTHILADCPSVSTDWFAFNSIVDPDNIVIDLPEVDPDDKTKTLANGIYLSADTIGGYAAFLSTEVRPVDKQMFFANGKLYFDEDEASYVITTEERLYDPSAAGNYLAFNTVSCTMKGEGNMSLGDGRSQLSLNSWGTIDYNLNNDNMVLDLVLGIDFPFNKSLSEALAASLNKKTALEGADMGRPAFKAALTAELDDKDRKKFMDDISNYGAPQKLPAELENTILLTDVKIKWTPTAVSFLSEGKIGVGAFGENIVNKKMEGYLEIQRRRRGDEIYLYLDAGNTYHYVEYKRNQLSIFSSEDEVMTPLKELDIKDRRSEAKGLPVFTYLIGTKGKMNRFLNRFEKFE